MLRFGAEPNRFSLGCFHLNISAFRAVGIVRFGGGREELEVVMISGEHLANTPNEMAVEGELSAWEVFF